MLQTRKLKKISLEKFSHGFASWAGSTSGFMAATFSLIGWIAAGKFYNFSQSWENALTIYIEVITFMMLFLMQRAQNKGLAALHIKLGELIAASSEADNRLINIEELSENEIREVKQTHRDIGQNLSTQSD